MINGRLSVPQELHQAKAENASAGGFVNSVVRVNSHLRFLGVNYVYALWHNYGLHCNRNSLENCRCAGTNLIHFNVHSYDL